MNALTTLFSWRGTLNRRDYLRHITLTTAIFALAFLVHVRYEAAFAQAMEVFFGNPLPLPLGLLFYLPFGTELLAAFGSPLALPSMLTILMAAADDQFTEQAIAMGNAAPALWLCIYALTTLLMLGGGLRCVGLAARRLRDAGSGIGRLALLFASLILLYALVLHDGLPFAAGLYVLALLICFIIQCCMLFRPTKPLPPAA